MRRNQSHDSFLNSNCLALLSPDSLFGRTGTPEIYPKIGPLFASGGSEQGASYSIKIGSGVAAKTTDDGWIDTCLSVLKKRS
jgi:hypothetical protein